MNIYSKTIIVSTIGAVVSLISGKLIDKFFPEKENKKIKAKPSLKVKKV